MSVHPTDEQFLQRALDLAQQGIGLTSPNPCVGAVIVDARGIVVGTGVHTYAGVKHAEVLALEAAGEKARGGAVYVNLEPCSHQGRTPPCTDALIAAGVRRVVASMSDPNPKVSGHGFEKLRAAGVQVEVGGLHEEAQRLNESFARYIRSRVPLVTLKSAMTLDGKIAPSPPILSLPTRATSDRREFTGREFTGTWITGEAARAHVHELRHQRDAIMVGAGTILADDPLLTDRSGRPRRRSLLRVIVDWRLRLPLESRLVQSVKAEKKTDVLVFYSSPLADEQKKTQLEQLGIRVEQMAAPDHRPDFPAILRRLGELEITSLLIEGGATMNGMFLAAGLVDKVFLYYAPKIFGSATAIPFAMGDGPSRMAESIPVKSTRLHRFGEDIAIEGYLRDPYKE